MSKYSVLIADDHELILNGLKEFLLNIDNIAQVATARNAEEVAAQLASHDYHIICLDIHFGNTDGRDLARSIRKSNPGVVLIALTSYDDVETIQSTIHAGFNAFFLKSDDLSEIKEWLLADRFDDINISSTAKKIYLNSHFMKDAKDIKAIKITQREREVLALIMDEYTTKQIAEAMFLSQKTIEAYRSNLMQKLDVTNTAGLVKKTILLGLLK